MRAPELGKTGVAGALAAVLLLTGCGPTAAPDGPPDAPAIELLEGQRSAVIGTGTQYGAFEVTVGYAVYDEVAQVLFVGTRWANRSDDYATAPRFNVARLDLGTGAEPTAGEVIGFDESAVPPGFAADVTFAWRYLAADPLADGRILFGAPGEHVASVALDGGGGDGQVALREVEVDEWANFGPHTIHVDEALVGAGHFSDNLQAPDGKRVLRIGLDVWTSTPSRVGWVASDSLALRLPSGGVVKSRIVPSVREVTWGAIEDSWAEFEIPAGEVGEYELMLFRRAPGIFGEPVVGNSAVFLPIDITDEAFMPVGPADRPDGAALPRPIVEPRKDPAAPPPVPGPDTAVELTPAPPVMAAGYGIELVEGVHSPAAGTLTLTLSVTYLGPESGDGVLSVPPSLTLPTSLQYGGRMTGALLLANGGTAGRAQQVTVTYYEIPADFIQTGPVLHLGNNAWIGFDGQSEPAIPSSRDVEAEAAAAGEFTVDVHSYRVGYFTGLDPAPGMVEIQFGYDVTTSSDESDHTLFFTPNYQLYLSREDGYVMTSSPLDATGIQQLELGVPKPVTTTFAVPRTWLDAGVLYLLVRSRDELDFPQPDGWLETTIPVHLN